MSDQRDHKSGISNRETPAEEQREREKLARHPDTARDRAGKIYTEAPAERLEREQDEHEQSADHRRGPNVKPSRSGT
jgi:hypothetical protein